MVSEDLKIKAIEWAKRNGYEHLISNEELVIELYRVNVLGERYSTRRKKRKYKLRRIGDMQEGERGRILAVVVDIIKEKKNKNGKWWVLLVGGDSTKKIYINSFPLDDRPYFELGKYYIFEGKYKGVDDFFNTETFSFWNYEAVDFDVAKDIDLVLDMMETMGNGRTIKKSRFEKMVGEKNRKSVMEIIGLVENGEMYELSDEVIE